MKPVIEKVGNWYRGGGTNSSVITNTSFQWHHIVFSSKIGLHQTYLNGVLVGNGTQNMISSVVSGNGNFQLGANMMGSYKVENGVCFDDVRFYSGIQLTQSQVTELYNGRIELMKNATSGGSGGGGAINISGASSGTKWNTTYSYLNNGSNGTVSQGGNGGSSFNGGFTELITGSNLIVDEFILKVSVPSI